MSEGEVKKSGGCAKVFGVLMVLGLVGTIVLAAVGTYLYFNWEKLGLPSMAEFQAQVGAAGAEAAAQQGADGAAVKRPIVASAPLAGTAAAYAEWTKRPDVLVLVDYYAEW